MEHLVWSLPVASLQSSLSSRSTSQAPPSAFCPRSSSTVSLPVSKCERGNNSATVLQWNMKPSPGATACRSDQLECKERKNMRTSASVKVFFMEPKSWKRGNNGEDLYCHCIIEIMKRNYGIQWRVNQICSKLLAQPHNGTTWPSCSHIKPIYDTCITEEWCWRFNTMNC